MRIRRRQPQHVAISLVSTIDVMMILLIFFMVTSTYLDLGMIPMTDPADDPVPQAAEPAAPGSSMLIRLGQDGIPRVRGRAVDAGGLTALLRAHLVDQPEAPVVVLPSGNASAQALVSLLDLVTAAGVRNLRILRLEAMP